MTQLAMDDCASGHAKEADAKLEVVYNKLMAQTSPAGQPKLQLAREAWTVYRAVQCDFDTLGFSTGSAYPMVTDECYAEKATEYTKVLQQQLNCPEGVIGCGGQ